MHETFLVILSQLRSAWRFRWLAILTAWAAAGLGYLAVANLPDEYEARALVYVDVASRLDEVIGGVAIEWDMTDQIERVRQEMLSLPVLEAVARETDLDLRATTSEGFSAVLSSLQQKINIQEARRRGADPRQATDTVLTIAFRDENREMALRVVDTLLKTFIGDVISGGQGDSAQAQAFLEQRIEEYQLELEQREQAVAQFKRENIGLLPGAESGDYFDRLQAEMRQLEALESELRTAQNRRDTLRAQLESENPELPQNLRSGDGTGSTTALGPLGPLQARIADQEARLDELRLQYTDAHIEVRAAQRQLEQLNERYESELRALAAAGGGLEGSPLSTNPVYQEIQSLLNQTNVDIAGLQSQISDRRSQIDELQARVDIIPDVEARLTGLVRDYEQVKQMHDELVSRLEQERLGTAAVADDVNFDIIQPPVADLNPTAPDRLLFLAAAFMAAVGAGGGIAFVLSQLRPVFTTTQDLRNFAELPVLGGVRAMRSPAQELMKKAQIAAFGAAGLLLVVTYAFGVMMRQEAAVLIQALGA